MTMRDRWARIAPLILVLLLGGGCASPISSELAKKARMDLDVSLVQRAPQAYKGVPVVWGGIIQKVDNLPGSSTLSVLQLPLDFHHRPKIKEDIQGRFIGQSDKFLDPLIYRRGRSITLGGKIAGTQVHPVGRYPYLFPKIEVAESHLWKTASGRARPILRFVDEDDEDEGGDDEDFGEGGDYDYNPPDYDRPYYGPYRYYRPYYPSYPYQPPYYGSPGEGYYDRPFNPPDDDEGGDEDEDRDE